jgi:hypothetical protein
MSSTILLSHANSFVIGPAAINNNIEYRNRPEEEHSIQMSRHRGG